MFQVQACLTRGRPPSLVLGCHFFGERGHPFKVSVSLSQAAHSAHRASVWGDPIWLWVVKTKKKPFWGHGHMSGFRLAFVWQSGNDRVIFHHEAQGKKPENRPPINERATRFCSMTSSRRRHMPWVRVYPWNKRVKMGLRYPGGYPGTPVMEPKSLPLLQNICVIFSCRF